MTCLEKINEINVLRQQYDAEMNRLRFQTNGDVIYAFTVNRAAYLRNQIASLENYYCSDQGAYMNTNFRITNIRSNPTITR